MAAKILVVFGEIEGGICKQAEKVLKDKGYSVEAFYTDVSISEKELLTQVPDLEAMIVSLEEVNEKVLEKAKKLKVVCKFGVGVDNIDIKAATKRHIVVTNIPGANAESVADLAFGFITGLAREIIQSDRLTKGSEWKVTLTHEVYEKVLGIIGLGQIGKAVARRASGFNMKILAYDIQRDQEFSRKHEVSYVSLEELLKKSDFVTIHTPLTPQTKGMIAKKQLEMMKNSAYIINTARGGIIDEEALYQLLLEGKIQGAALDAYSAEPYEGALLKLDNVICTAHIGGTTYEAINRMWPIAVDNVVKVLDGQRPSYVVNPEVYSG